MKDKKGFVYVLRNEAFPELLKIGLTQQQNWRIRIKKLYSTGVPLPFECLYACETEDCKSDEKLLHDIFDDYRINPNREFFKISSDKVIPLLKRLAIKDMTEEVDEAVNEDVSKEEKDAIGKYLKRRPNLNFDEMGIPINSELVYTYNNNIKVVVISSQRIQYNDKEYSLSGITKELLQVSYYVGPCRYWLYNGKNLDEIYNETYPIVEE